MMPESGRKARGGKTIRTAKMDCFKGKLEVFPFSLSRVKLIFRVSILESVQAKEKEPHSLLASGNKLILSRANAGWRP